MKCPGPICKTCRYATMSAKTRLRPIRFVFIVSYYPTFCQKNVMAFLLSRKGESFLTFFRIKHNNK